MDVAGGRIADEVIGDGPPVVLSPGIGDPQHLSVRRSADRECWLPRHERLALITEHGRGQRFNGAAAVYSPRPAARSRP